MISKSKRNVVRRRILKLLEDANDGLGFNTLASAFKPKRSSYYEKASRPTVIEALKELQEESYVQRDPRTRMYKITSQGKKYARLSEIVDFILSSTALDSAFDWSVREKGKVEEISAAYMLATSKEGSGEHALAFLHKRLRRTHRKGWDFDVVNYAYEMGLLSRGDVAAFKHVVKGCASIEEIETLQKRLRKVWRELFRGVERLTIVETVNPELLLGQIEEELLRNCCRVLQARPDH